MLAVSMFLMLYGSIGFISRYHFRERFGVLICIIGVLIACLCTKPKFNINTIITFGFLSVLGTVTGFFHGDSLKVLAHCVVNICVAFAWVCFVDFDSFKRSFLDVLLFTAGFNIVAWVVYSIDPTIIKNIFPELPSSSADVFDLFFGVIRDTKYGNIRLYGFAWEPGAYQTFLNVAILIAGMQKKHRLLNLCILYVALLLTFSTTGYIVGILNVIVLIFAININNKKLLKRFLIVAAGGFVVLFAVAVATGVANTVFKKVLDIFKGVSTDDHYTSASVRVDSIVYPLIAFLHNPLFGVGKVGLQEISSTLPHSMLTCTPINYLARYGILFFAVVITCWYKFIKLIVGNNRFIILGGLMSFLLSIASEQYVAFIIMNVVILYGSTMLTNKTSTPLKELKICRIRIPLQ